MTASPKKKKNSNREKLSKEDRELIKQDYLTGKSIDSICKKFKITKSQFNSLRTRHRWKDAQKEIDRRTEEQVLDILVSQKTKALLRIANDATLLMDKAMKILQDEKEYEEIPIYNTEGDIATHKKPYTELYAMARIWNLGVSRLLRALGEPETIRDLPEDGNTQRPVFNVLIDVGLKKDFREKIINGAFTKNESKSN